MFPCFCTWGSYLSVILRSEETTSPPFLSDRNGFPYANSLAAVRKSSPPEPGPTASPKYLKSHRSSGLSYPGYLAPPRFCPDGLVVFPAVLFPPQGIALLCPFFSPIHRRSVRPLCTPGPGSCFLTRLTPVAFRASESPLFGSTSRGGGRPDPKFCLRSRHFRGPLFLRLPTRFGTSRLCTGEPRAARLRAPFPFKNILGPRGMRPAQVPSGT